VTNVVTCTLPGEVGVFGRDFFLSNDFCYSWPVKSGGRRGYPCGYPYNAFLLILTHEVRWQTKIPKWLSAPFVNQRRTSPIVLGWCWSTDSVYFENFCRFLLSSSRDIQAWWRARFLSARWGWSNLIACGNVVVIPFYRFQGTEVLLMPRCLFLSEWQIPLVGIFISQIMFRSNEISVISLLPFYHQ